MEATRNERACIAWREGVLVGGDGHLLMRRTKAGSLVVDGGVASAPLYRINNGGENETLEALADFVGVELAKIPLLICKGILRRVLVSNRLEVWHLKREVTREMLYS